MNTRLIPLTDRHGKTIVDADESYEPLPGSIVLADGQHGTAWQRFFSDGLWYPAGRNTSTGERWETIIAKPSVVLVYDAPERPRR